MPEAPVTRASLLIRIRDVEDAEAWRQFLDLYGPFLHGWYRKRGLQDADACDLSQEVLHAVSTGADRFDYEPGKGTFRSWLFTIARRKLYDLGRRRQREPRPLGTDVTMDFVLDQTAEAEREQWDRAYQRRLFEVAAEVVREQVEETTWLAFWRTAVEGRSPHEVADELETTVGTVYVAKSRVLARLKTRIDLIQGDED